MIVDENLNDWIIKKLKTTSILWFIAWVLMTIAWLLTFIPLMYRTEEVKELRTKVQQDEQIINIDNRQDTIDAMIVAFAVQESNTTENAVSDCGKYVGCIQMSKIMVDEANRILGYDNFTHDDRFVWDSCARMFEIVQTYHNPTLDIDKAITIWNKGCPNSYRNNVKKVYKGVLRHLTNKQ